MNSRVPRAEIFQSVQKWFMAGSRRYHYELLRARKDRNGVTKEKTVRIGIVEITRKHGYCKFASRITEEKAVIAGEQVVEIRGDTNQCDVYLEDIKLNALIKASSTKSLASS